MCVSASEIHVIPASRAGRIGMQYNKLQMPVRYYLQYWEFLFSIRYLVSCHEISQEMFR
jgi:hypothetical protein